MTRYCIFILFQLINLDSITFAFNNLYFYDENHTYYKSFTLSKNNYFCKEQKNYYSKFSIKLYRKLYRCLKTDQKTWLQCTQNKENSEQDLIQMSLVRYS